MFKFLNTKKAALFALGISINIPEKGNTEIRYARVVTQIQKLSPEKQTMFNNLRDHFILEERKKEAAIAEQERIEAEKEAERQQAAAEMSEAKRKLLENLDMSKPVNELPDCLKKY